MKIRLSWVIALLFTWVYQTNATHIAGGQITYKCLGQGNFEFTVSITRDCGGNTAGWVNTSITLRGPHGSTSLPLVASFDFSPRCASGLTMACNPASTGLGTAGAQSKFIFRGIVDLDSVPPAPVNTGHTFWVTLPCCRSSSISNSLAVNGSQALVVKMYRYTDPLTGNALSPAQLCDASPDFLQDQALVFMNNPLDTIRMQHSGFDPNLEDSLVYSIIAPVNDQRVPFAFTHPYSMSNPIPGLLGSAAVGAGNSPINPRNGEVVIRPNTLGSFVMPVQISAYRQGQLIAEVIREQIMRVVPFSSGTPPTIPIGNDIFFMQRAPQIQEPSSAFSMQRGFAWDFYAGDTVALGLAASDYFPFVTGDPAVPSSWVPVVNSLRVALNGPMISTDHVAATGCALPNCATIRGYFDPLPPAPAATLPVNLQQGNGLTVGQGYAGLSETGAQFHWATSCSLIPATGSAVIFNFRVIAMDSACVLEGRNDATVSIRLRNLPPAPAPQLTSLAFDSVRLQYTLHFTPNMDTTTVDSLDRNNFTHLSPAALKARSVNRRLASFQSYRIYRADGMQTPWVLVGTTTNPFDSVFVDTTLFTGSHQVFYQVVAVSGCESSELRSNTLQAIFNSTSVQDLAKSLNHVRLMPNPGRDVYRLQADEGHFLPGRWELRDMQGRLLQVYNLPEGTSSQELDLSSRTTGIYLLHATEVGKAIRLVHQP